MRMRRLNWRGSPDMAARRLTCLSAKRRVRILFRCRLIPEVVIMVLRGAQFRRSGPAGCIFLTRRALSSCNCRFSTRTAGCHLPATREPDDVQTSAIPRRRSMSATSHRTRVTWRGSVTYVRGILGNCDQPRSIDRDADCVHAVARFQWQ